MAKYWYSYSASSTQTPASRLVTTNYTQITPATASACPTGSQICAILAPGATNPSSPFSSRLQNYILSAATNSADQPTGTAKKYVYVKS